MIYFYNSFLSNHWKMITDMVSECYATEDNANDVLVLGATVYRNCETIRREYYPNANKIIAYQLEPLISGHWHNAGYIIENLKGADEVWDYDLDNIEVLKQHGIDAKFKPMLYANSLKKVPSADNLDIDVLFFGSATESRDKFFRDFAWNFHFDAIRQARYTTTNIVRLFNIDDVRLDEFISRSKIILNLHPYDNDLCRQQQTRIFYSLINNKCVMSQRANTNYFGDCIVEFDNYQDFGEKVVDLLTDDKWKNYPANSRDWQSFQNKEVKVTKTYKPTLGC